MFGAEDIALFFARLLLAIMFVVSALDKFRLDPVEMGQISSLHLPAPAALERARVCLRWLGQRRSSSACMRASPPWHLRYSSLLSRSCLYSSGPSKVQMTHASWCVISSSATSR